MDNTNIVFYTAIFGGYDGLLPQPVQKGIDYVCFTDQPFRSKSWQIIHHEPPFEDPTRSSKVFKINPHKFLPDHQRSVWIDGNFLVRGKPAPWAHNLLNQKPMWVYDHNQTPADPRNCLYKEYEALMEMYRTSGRTKDKPEVMKAQMERYRAVGYPENNGLLSGGILIREHHHPEVIKTMELWWEEIQKGSRRDQLSFNYAAWRNGFDFGFVDGDIRRNEHFFQIGIHRPDYKGKYIRYRLKRIFRLV